MLVKEAAKDRLYVLTNPSFDRRALVFPMDTTAPDYAEAVMLVVVFRFRSRGVQNDYFSRIEEVRRELRSPEKQTDDTFIGCAEQHR